MNPFVPVDLSHATRLINHGPTVLVTTAHGGRQNVMAAAWSMPIEFTPPRIALVIGRRTVTHELALAAGGFALSVPGPGLADITYAVGNMSARNVPDKFGRFGLVTQTGPALGMPVIEQGCCAWLECRLIPGRHTEEVHDVCFAEVVAAAADPRVFVQGRWTFEPDCESLRTIHHMGAGHFGQAGDVVKADSALWQ